MFPTHKELEAMGVESAQMASFQLPNGFQTPYNGIPGASDNSSSIPNAPAHTSFSTVGLNNLSGVYQERPQPYTTHGSFHNANPLESTGHPAVRIATAMLADVVETLTKTIPSDGHTTGKDLTTVTSISGCHLHGL